MRKYTVADIMKLGPCYDIQRVKQLWSGRKELSLTEICQLDIDPTDIIWVASILLPERAVRLFTCDCAEHVLHLFERNYPDDERPRRCIDIARRYATGNASEEELAAARAATMTTARYAASGAAYDAADAAADAAARDATSNAAKDTAWAATNAAADAAADAAARDAGWAAASDVVMVAARDAAWDAAKHAEQKWQIDRLIEYVTKTVADSMKERGHA